MSGRHSGAATISEHMESSAIPRDDRTVIRSPGWDIRIAGALFLGWIVLSRFGPTLELSPGVRAWFPPAALLAAACILWGARALPPTILAAAALSYWASPDSASFWHGALVGTFFKLVYWAAAHTLRARGFDLGFSRPVDVARFSATFVIASAVIALAGTIDMTGLASLTEPRGLLVLRTYVVGDIVAITALAPGMIVAVCWLANTTPASIGATLRRLLRRPSPAGALQFLSIPATVALSNALAPSVGFFAYALCFLALGWIALTRGPRAAAIANLVLSLSVVWSVHHAAIPAPRTLELQVFVGMLALTGLLVGSIAGERERAFALLGESEERYRKLVELLPDPLVVHADGRIIFANRAAAAVLGADAPARLTGVALADLAAPRSRNVIEERLRALARGTTDLPLVHHTMKRLDGSGAVEVESVSIPLTYQGRAAALTVARDVTQRVRLEEDLRHAQRMEAVGRLAGGVAHDFNNLLTVIISYCELLARQLTDDTKLSHDVQEIRQAADRASALTRQLLSFSRRQVLQPAALDLNDVMRGAEALLRRLISSEIEILTRLDPAVGTVFVDRGQLEQVIINLVVNARDAMPDGGVLTLETRLVRAAEAPATARAAVQADHFAAIIVRDTGMGMDEMTMRRIFDPFFTTKDVGRGTGLGLSTVHGIVDQSGGAVTVESHPGVGSEFRVLLPSVGVAPASSADHAARERAPSLPPAVHARVLLVEDDPAVRAGLRRMLEAAGHEVVEAHDGQAALAVVERGEHFPGVVLSDIAMPTLDGRQLARALHSRWPSLPVILMSGFADRAALLDHDSSGIVVLQKPLEPHALAAAVQAAVSAPPA